MNRWLSLGIAVAYVVASAMSAQAANLPGRSNSPSYYKAPPELPFSWTGFYAGINGGYAWGQSGWSDPAVGVDSGNFNTSGGLVGGQLGYNWQTGPVVPTQLCWVWHWPPPSTAQTPPVPAVLPLTLIQSASVSMPSTTAPVCQL